MMTPMVTRIFCVAIFFHLFTEGTVAQIDAWTPSSGPDGGRVFGLAELPSGTVLASVENAGIFRSTNTGRTWQATGWYTGTFVRAATSSNGTIFFAGYSGLIRSTDDGLTWEKVQLGGVNESLESIDISADDRIYIGSFYNHVGMSTDLGVTWQVLPISFSYWPTPVREVFCYGADIVFIFADSDGLYVTTDGGNTWEHRGFENFSIQDGGLGRLGDGSLLLGSAGGVRHSLDTGRTWAYFNPPGDPTESVWGYRWDNPSLSMAYKTDSLYVTQDHGVSWTPIAPPSRESFYLGSMVLSDNTILAGTNGDGIYHSTNVGGSWTDASGGLGGTTTWHMVTGQQARMYAATDRGMFQSTDGGASWHLQRTCPPHVGAAIQAEHGAVIAATETGLYRSADGSDAYVQVRTDSYWSALSRDSSGRIFAGGARLIMVSTDEGVRWDHSDSVTNKVWKLLSTDTTTYASIYGNGIRRTTDGGRSWHDRSDSLPHSIVYGLASMDGVLFAGSPLGQLAVLESGSSVWSTRSSLPSTCWTLLPTPDGVLFAGTTTGVYRSSDQGVSWVPFGVELSDRRVYSLDLRPDNRLVAGLANGPAHISSQPVVARVLQIDVPSNFTLEQNFPNPFNPSTSISFRLPVASNVSLKIFDLLGREIAVLLSEDRSAGAHTISWNAGAVASGMYFYRLEATGVDKKGWIESKRMVLLR